MSSPLSTFEMMNGNGFQSMDASGDPLTKRLKLENVWYRSNRKKQPMLSPVMMCVANAKWLTLIL